MHNDNIKTTILTETNLSKRRMNSYYYSGQENAFSTGSLSSLFATLFWDSFIGGKG
jgi:hypothetical protein